LNADVAAALDYPVLVVAPNRLGVINQVLQTVLAIRHARPGVHCLGVVLNDMAPDTADPSQPLNRSALEAWCEVPILTQVEHGSGLVAEVWEWLGSL
ncbi:MAG TPA: AAA family ATPase, partial [Pirellulaceae bacterium]